MVKLGLGVEMKVDEKWGPTTLGDLEDNSHEHRIGSSDSTRHTSGYAIAVDIRECRRSSAGHQVGDLGKTTSFRSGRVALFQNVFVPSSSPQFAFRRTMHDFKMEWKKWWVSKR